LRAKAWRQQRIQWQDALVFGMIENVTWEIADAPGKATLPGID
jgi:hypothetical protein